MSRFAYVRVERFAAAAHERCEPALRDRAFVVVTGTAPTRRIVEASAAAAACGVGPGLTETEARARAVALVTRPLSDELIAAAGQALLEAMLGVSPRVAEDGPGQVIVDIGGLARLFGGDEGIARRLARGARGIGLEPLVGIASTRAAARIAARLAGTLTDRSWWIIAPGHEPRVLAPAPLSLLDLTPDTGATLTRWGVATIGALARLPREGLARRLGPAGLRAHDQALGVDREPFRPWTPPPFWQEAQGLDWEIVSWDALAAVLGLVLERLTARLHAGHVWADSLHLDLGLASGGHDERTIGFASVLQDPKPMLALLGLELEARPPAEPIIRVTVSAHAVAAEPAQARLGERPAPMLRDLGETLARLATLVGRANVGSPRVVDSHRADSIALAPFVPSAARDREIEPYGRANHRSSRARGEGSTHGIAGRDETTARDARDSSASAAEDPETVSDRGETQSLPGAEPDTIVARLAFRRLRPPRRVDVDVRDEARPAPRATDRGSARDHRAETPANAGGDAHPISVRFHDVLGGVSAPQAVVACAGPWRTSGEWWDHQAWARDEWDVALADGMVCRLVRDRRSGEWFLDGAYD